MHFSGGSKCGVQMTTEQELLQRIRDNEVLLKDARLNVSALKEKLTNEETRLIGLKLDQDRMVAQLKALRNASYKPDPDPREEDNARFLAALPSLLEKIK
jgi:hypothetical protein